MNRDDNTTKKLERVTWILMITFFIAGIVFIIIVKEFASDFRFNTIEYENLHMYGGTLLGIAVGMSLTTFFVLHLLDKEKKLTSQSQDSGKMN